MSCKELTDHSHLVAIKPTGNVFLYDTVQQLNLKPKMLRDLVDDTPFTKADLLTLQDPHDPERRTMQKLYRMYATCGLTLDVQNKLTLATTEQADEVHMSTGSTRALLSQVRQHAAADDAKEAAPAASAASSASGARAPRLSNLSTGRTAASFTSSSLTPRTKTERIEVDEEAEMFDHVAGASKHPKALVRLVTNFGALDIELHVDKAPRTVRGRSSRSVTTSWSCVAAAPTRIPCSTATSPALCCKVATRRARAGAGSRFGASRLRTSWCAPAPFGTRRGVWCRWRTAARTRTARSSL